MLHRHAAWHVRVYKACWRCQHVEISKRASCASCMQMTEFDADVALDVAGAAVHLLAAYRPQSRRPSGERLFLRCRGALSCWHIAVLQAMLAESEQRARRNLLLPVRCRRLRTSIRQTGSVMRTQPGRQAFMRPCMQQSTAEISAFVLKMSLVCFWLAGSGATSMPWAECLQRPWRNVC